ncbi:MAG: response regulator [Alphaproteobacteria bacterium]|nr:response regulator [Alphaproteobacteria bacterium]
MTAKLLIVDDDVNTIRLMNDALRGEGDLFFATSGAAAIRIAHEKKPDIVLLDAEMPEMDGFEVCRALKADPATAAATIIFVTAYSDIESEIRALDLGAIDFIHKPISPPLVRARVRNHVIIKVQAELAHAAKAQAEQANAAKSRFLAAASHDLRQPLQALIWYKDSLLEMVEDTAALTLLARCDEALDAMTDILNTLLDINQLEAGVVRAEMSCFPISRLLERLARQFACDAAVRDLDLRVVQNRLPVVSDPRLLEHILRNLLSNAVKYTPKGKVLLGCRRRGDTLRIEVLDRGTGIPEEQLQAVFEEFHQVNNAARERSKGLGLGLAIVQRLASLLEHTIDVRSELGKGSVFAITVPLSPEPPLPLPGSLTQDGVPRSSPPRQSNTVLIVEDDPAVRGALRLMLNRAGYRTLSAGDGDTALAKALSAAIQLDLIIADYNLPNSMNGLQVIAHLRELARDRQLPAIILTGDIATDTRQEITRQGCEYICKPVSPTELLRHIRYLLGQI